MKDNRAGIGDADEHFAFGENWQRFLALIDGARIAAAEQSLKRMLAVDSLTAKSFIDVGSGSGLFSLAARRLGAKVSSFDYDPRSVACTEELKRRYFAGDPEWVVQQGSILDRDWVRSLGRFDVVYSWGVLHHTGALWQAIENAVSLVNSSGELFIAIYNDQGPISQYWAWVKGLYARRPFRPFLIALHWPYLVGARWVWRTISRRPLERGMSYQRDLIDWLGGYPFEVAKPREVIEFLGERGLILASLKDCGTRHGCNEFVFRKT